MALTQDDLDFAQSLVSGSAGAAPESGFIARGLRNKNPGNIVKTKSPWDGEIDGGDSRFKIFETDEDGLAAIGSNLLAYNDKHGLDTVSGIINRWAPPNENDTSSYVKSVASSLGVAPDQKIDIRNPEVMANLSDAIVRKENRKNPYSREQMLNAAKRAITGRRKAEDIKRNVADKNEAKILTQTALSGSDGGITREMIESFADDMGVSVGEAANIMSGGSPSAGVDFSPAIAAEQAHKQKTQMDGPVDWGKKLSAAIDSYQANLLAIPAALGSEYAMKAMQENKAAAEQGFRDAGGPQSWDEMEFGKNFGQYFGHLFVQSAPYLAEFAATGFGLGSVLKKGLATTAERIATKAAAEAVTKGATAAQAAKLGNAAADGFFGTIGGVIGSYPSSTGDVLSNQYEQAGKFNMPAAAALGIPYAALNAAGVEGMMMRGLARGLPGISAKVAGKGIAGAAGRAAITSAETGLVEGTTETGQEVTNQFGRMAVDPNATLTSGDAPQRYKESFIAGSLMGGAMGAAAGPFRKPNSPLTNAANAAAPAPAGSPPVQVGGPGAAQLQPPGMPTSQAPVVSNQPGSANANWAGYDVAPTVYGRPDLDAKLAGMAQYLSADYANEQKLVDQLKAAGSSVSTPEQLRALWAQATEPGVTVNPQIAENMLAMLSIPNFTRPEPSGSLVPSGGARTAVGPVRRGPDGNTIDGEATTIAGTLPGTPRQLPAPPVPALTVTDESARQATAEYEAAYQDLVKAESLGTDDRLLMQKQIALRNAEARLQEIQSAIEGNRQVAEASKRDALLSDVLSNLPDGQNPLRAFDRALRKAGFNNTDFTEAEKQKIARWLDIKNADSGTPTAVETTPNEMDAAAMGIRERGARVPPGIAKAAPQSRYKSASAEAAKKARAKKLQKDSANGSATAPAATNAAPSAPVDQAGPDVLPGSPAVAPVGGNVQPAPGGNPAAQVAAPGSGAASPDGVAAGGRSAVALAAARPWDQENRNRRGDEWFEGARVNESARAGFTDALANGGANLQAHGMGKERTLGGGIQNLLNMLSSGLDPNRGGGILQTAPLVSRPGEGLVGATASGSAYSDGPFMLVARPGESLTGNLSGLGAILINQAHADIAPQIADAIRAIRPDIIVAPYSEAGSVARQLNSQDTKASTASAPLSDADLDAMLDQAQARVDQKAAEPETAGVTLNDVPPKLMKKIKVPVERMVVSDVQSDVQTVEVSANEAIADLDEEISAYEKLLACVRSAA